VVSISNEIIGGADAPTSIMVYSSVDWVSIISAAVVVIAVLVVFFVWRTKNKK
jgi:Na+-transporting methylmalonyl-CoA/oxaloacetate decarboxylase beta subunit